MSDPREEPLVPSDDVADELEALWFERLLDVVPGVDDLPGAPGALAAVLLALRAPATDEDLAGEAAAIAVYRSCQAVGTSPPARNDRARTAKVLTVAAAVALATVTGGAAAAGRLPADVQDMASELLGKVGIHIPVGDRTKGEDPPRPDGRPAPGTGPVTAAPVSGGSPRALETGSGTATTDLVRPSVTDPRAVTPPAEAAPAAARVTDTSTPAGAVDAVNTDVAAGAPRQRSGAPPAATAAPVSVPAPSASPPGSPPADVPASPPSSKPGTSKAPPHAGPPVTPPANGHAPPHAGPPVTPPANGHGPPHAGPPVTPPANGHAPPHAGPPVTPPANPGAGAPADPPVTPPTNAHGSPPADVPRGGPPHP
jgi:hypothetical protein